MPTSSAYRCIPSVSSSLMNLGGVELQMLTRAPVSTATAVMKELVPGEASVRSLCVCVCEEREEEEGYF